MFKKLCLVTAGTNTSQTTSATNSAAELVTAVMPAPSRIPLFSLGQIVATPPAVVMMQEAGITARELLQCHVTGDWEGMNADDAALNWLSVKTGGRIFSAFVRDNVTIWVITEADRSSTCLLLPSCY